MLQAAQEEEQDELDEQEGENEGEAGQSSEHVDAAGASSSRGNSRGGRGRKRKRQARAPPPVELQPGGCAFAQETCALICVHVCSFSHPYALICTTLLVFTKPHSFLTLPLTSCSMHTANHRATGHSSEALLRGHTKHRPRPGKHLLIRKAAAYVCEHFDPKRKHVSLPGCHFNHAR